MVESDVPQVARDRFDRAEWLQLLRAVEAGARSDLNQFKAELHVMDRAFPMSGRAGAYISFSLRYLVGKRLQRRPSRNDLSDVAAAIYPHFQVLVLSSDALLTELLSMIFDFRPVTEPVSGANLIVNGAAALSALVSEIGELVEIEDSLAKWYDKNGEEFAALRPLGS